MLLSALILMTSKEPKAFTNYLSLFIIATLGFVAPLFALVVAVPIFVIVYINNMDSLKTLWVNLNKLSLK